MKLKYLGLSLVGSRAAYAAIITLFCIIFCLIPEAGAVTSFQPYRSPGNNLIHITTADFWGVGAKKYVVGMTVDNRVLCFGYIPGADTNNIAVTWTNNLGQFGFMLAAASLDSSGKEKILIPCADGHLRILDKDNILTDCNVSTGALYSVAVGVNSSGLKRIITGGVDGKLYIYNGVTNNLTLKGTKTLGGCIKGIYAGDFDGAGGDEIVVCLKMDGYNTTTDGSLIEVINLTDDNTVSYPAYWKPQGAIIDDSATSMGWGDRLPLAVYDLDRDGKSDVVGPWGFMNPTNSQTGTLCLSDLIKQILSKNAGGWVGYNQFTPAGGYIMQKTIPGNFRSSTGFEGEEIFTMLGDDLYLWGYDPDTTNFPVSLREYGYAHPLYQFSDCARLEKIPTDNSPDKIVLCGPNNGDDRFYIVDLSSSSWTNDAKLIHTDGTLKTVESNLDTLETRITDFSGSGAKGTPIKFIDIAGSPPGWWVMSDLNIATHADGVLAAQTNFYYMVNGDSTKATSNIVFYAQCMAHMGAEAADYTNVTAVGLQKWCAAMAARKVHFCMIIGHCADSHIDPSDLADCFSASVANGTNYMMLRVWEVSNAGDIDSYHPHMDALNTRAAALGIAPPKIILDGKGAVFTSIGTNRAATYFQAGSAHGTNIILGAESSNSRLPEWSLAERVGLWMDGYVSGWGCEVIGDCLAANRLKEWSHAMYNGNLVLRRLMSQYALGATVFRFDGSVSKTPCTGETLSEPWRHGTINFLKIVEKGIYPPSPTPSRLKGISPVAVALPSPNSRFTRQSYFHSWESYAPQSTNYSVNNLECWNAYTKVPSYDATAFLHGTTRRWDNMFPISDSGFVAVVPFDSTNNLLGKAWWKKAYQTDANTWAGFSTLTAAQSAISSSLNTQRTNMMFYVDCAAATGNCFWQFTQDKDNPNKLYLLLMDRNALTPTALIGLKLKKGNAAGVWDVYNRLIAPGSNYKGALTNTTDIIWSPVDAGSIQIFEFIKR